MLLVLHMVSTRVSNWHAHSLVTHTHTHTLSLTHTCNHTYAQIHSLIPSHKHTVTHTDSHTHRQSHTYTRVRQRWIQNPVNASPQRKSFFHSIPMRDLEIDCV